MNKRVRRIIVLLVFTIPSVLLFYFNYNIHNSIIEKKKNMIENKEKKEVNLNKSNNQYGFYEILNYIDEKDNYKILSISEPNEENICSVEVEYCGGLKEIIGKMQLISERENYLDMNNLEICQCKRGQYLARFSVDFLKNNN